MEGGFLLVDVEDAGGLLIMQIGGYVLQTWAHENGRVDQGRK